MIPNSKPEAVISINEHGMDLLIESLDRVYGYPSEAVIDAFLYNIARVGLLKFRLIRPSDDGQTSIHSIEEYPDGDDRLAPPTEECLEFLEARAALVGLTNRDIARHEHAWLAGNDGE